MKGSFSTLIIALLLVACAPVEIIQQEPNKPATQTAPHLPYISIIIDDIGNDLAIGKRILQLPYPITLSILPHTPHSQTLHQLAYQLNKELMLHLPMQALHNNRYLGPGSLTLNMSEQQFRRTLRENLQSLPDAIGVNNHMGSLLTSQQKPMNILMEELANWGTLFFIDSRTTAKTIAYQSAIQHGLAAQSRDLFLDNRQDEDYIRQQFQLLIKKAKENGSALAIAHPHTSTINVLESELEQLHKAGVNIIPVSQHVAYQQRQQEALNPPPHTDVHP
ncbi:MAG: divergent polysaccharide deacetylase family protein [Gammaproteobacteria bacterium]|nr:divergent polysaccharide deacetylase family protein [Gammaproteobacteria bacterium]